MGMWMELRCDELSTPKCYSGKNNGPMEMTHVNVPAVTKTLRILTDEARKAGWVRTKRDDVYVWLCPECARGR